MNPLRISCSSNKHRNKWNDPREKENLGTRREFPKYLISSLGRVSVECCGGTCAPFPPDGPATGFNKAVEVGASSWRRESWLVWQEGVKGPSSRTPCWAWLLFWTTSAGPRILSTALRAPVNLSKGILAPSQVIHLQTALSPLFDYKFIKTGSLNNLQDRLAQHFNIYEANTQ